MSEPFKTGKWTVPSRSKALVNDVVYLQNMMLFVEINILYLNLFSFSDQVAQFHAEEADRGSQV